MVRNLVLHHKIWNNYRNVTNCIFDQPTTNALYGKEQFSYQLQWIASSINTPLPNVNGSAFAEAYQMSMSAQFPLNVTGWHVCIQAATLLEITTWLVSDIGRGFNYTLWLFECNEASLWVVSPWTKLHCNLPLCDSPPPQYKCLWC